MVSFSLQTIKHFLKFPQRPIGGYEFELHYKKIKEFGDQNVSVATFLETVFFMLDNADLVYLPGFEPTTNNHGYEPFIFTTKLACNPEKIQSFRSNFVSP